MAERPYHKAMSVRSRGRAAAAGVGQGARSGGRGQVHRTAAGAPGRGDNARTDDAAAPPPETHEQAVGRPAAGLTPEPVEEERLRRHRARPSRDLRALRNRAGDGHEPRRRRHDGAHLVRSSAISSRFRAARSSCYNEEPTRCAAVRDRASTRTSSSRLRSSNGEGLTGWVARNRRALVNARPSADLEAAGSDARRTLQSALVCPLLFSERFIGTLSRLPRRRRLLSRRSSPAARPGVASRRRRSSTTRCCSSRRRKTR